MSKKELHQTGVVITRPSHQTGEIKALVNEHQGHPIEFPLLEIKSKSQNEVFQNIVLKLDDYDWAIFISSNAVQFGMPAVKHAFHTLPKSTQFAAIGPSTQKALKLFDVNHVLIPDENFDSEGLLATKEMNDIKVLYAHLSSKQFRFTQSFFRKDSYFSNPYYKLRSM